MRHARLFCLHSQAKTTTNPQLAGNGTTQSHRNFGLDDQGWAVVYATAREVMRQPWQLVDRVSRRLALPRVSH